MKHFLLFFVFLPTLFLNAQNVNIPDANFKAALVGNTAINTNGDSEIQVSEATNFTGEIDVSSSNITDLTGIEAFTNINGLSASFNEIETISINSLINLQTLIIAANKLTSIDLSNNNLINRLDLSGNQLTSIDLSNLTNLGILYLFNGNPPFDTNSFVELDLSNNPNLFDVELSGLHSLEQLNLANGNNTVITTFSATFNPRLSCIQIDSGFTPPPYNTTTFTGWQKDDSTGYSTDCSGLVNIPDANFRVALTANDAIDTNMDDLIQITEATNFTGEMDVSNSSITDLTGIEAFVNLTGLKATNNDLGSVDLSANPLLISLDLARTNISNIDVSQMNSLETLILGDNFLSDFTNAITSIDLSNNTALKELRLTQNQLGTIDVSNNVNLESLDVFFCGLNAIDIQNNTLLTTLNLTSNNISSIDLSNNNLLESLILGFNNISSIDLSNNSLLEVIGFNNNSFDTLDFSFLPNLISINLSRLDNLEQLNIANGNNAAITNVNTTFNPKLSCIQIDAGFTPPPYDENTFEGWQKDANAGYSSDCNTVVHIPDSNFRTDAVTDNAIDTNGDNLIQSSEASAFTGTIDLANQNVTELTGIEAFTNITALNASNNTLSNVDLSTNTQLTTLNLGSNQLGAIDLSNNTQLEFLDLSNNNLNTVASRNQSTGFSNLTALKELRLQDNQMTNLDVSNAPDLELLWVANNNLGSIDVGSNTQLKNLWIDNTGISSLDLSNNNLLEFLYASSNTSLNNINLNNLTELKDLFLRNNNITTLDLNNNSNLLNLSLSNNQISTVDISQNLLLESINLFNNQLATIDLSQHPNLTFVDMGNNNLTEFDIANGNNTNITTFSAFANSSLGCINIDDGFTPPAFDNTTGLGWLKDAAATFSPTCATASVSDVSVNSGTRIHPNPVANTLYVESPNNIVQSINLYDISGKLLKTVSDKNSIDVKDLYSGIYLARITTDKGVETHRIVKQ